jgi:hypothetical protein
MYSSAWVQLHFENIKATGFRQYNLVGTLSLDKKIQISPYEA